jgi:hypothetical protein
MIQIALNVNVKAKVRVQDAAWAGCVVIVFVLVE